MAYNRQRRRLTRQSVMEFGGIFMCINTLVFKILDIQYGWIFAALETEDGPVGLSNSYLGGLQMPGIFLKALIELLNKNEHEKWICWHGESNSYVWRLAVKHEMLELFVYDGDSSFGLPLEGSSLSKYAVPSGIILEAKTSLYLFAQSVYDAFKFYSYGEGYETWQNSRYKDQFPRAEVSQLRKILRQNGYK